MVFGSLWNQDVLDNFDFDSFLQSNHPVNSNLQENPDVLDQYQTLDAYLPSSNDELDDFNQTLTSNSPANSTLGPDNSFAAHCFREGSNYRNDPQFVSSAETFNQSAEYGLGFVSLRDALIDHSECSEDDSSFLDRAPESPNSMSQTSAVSHERLSE